eukprot:2125990-Rhodomonas_salina.2
MVTSTALLHCREIIENPYTLHMDAGERLVDLGALVGGAVVHTEHAVGAEADIVRHLGIVVRPVPAR